MFPNFTAKFGTAFLIPLFLRLPPLNILIGFSWTLHQTSLPARRCLFFPTKWSKKRNITWQLSKLAQGKSFVWSSWRICGSWSKDWSLGEKITGRNDDELRLQFVRGDVFFFFCAEQMSLKNCIKREGWLINQMQDDATIINIYIYRIIQVKKKKLRWLKQNIKTCTKCAQVAGLRTLTLAFTLLLSVIYVCLVWGLWTHAFWV